MEKRLILSAFIIISICMITGCKSKEYYITDNEALYDTAIKYLINNDDNPEKENDRYKMFTEYEGFGIMEDKNYRYAYMWIADESYYVVDDKLVSGSGSSMPYKFTFNLKENKVIKYETPKNGNEYVKSIKDMFPDDIEKKVINYTLSDDRLVEQVKDYYSDLSDKAIYFYTGEEYIKVDE